MKPFAMKSILRVAACAIVLAVASPCYGQLPYPTGYGARYSVLYPGYYGYFSGHPHTGRVNGPYYSTTSRAFGTRAYYDSVPFGSSWYSGYYASPVYNGGHSYNFEPYFGR